MDRTGEFREIVKLLGVEESQVRNRLKSGNVEGQERDSLLSTPSGLITFGRTFLGECNLMNSTLLQLNGQFERIKRRPDQISFSSTNNSNNSNETNSIEEALDICSANLAHLESKIQAQAEETARPANNSSFLSRLFTATEREDDSGSPLLEHCGLVVKFLRGRIGRLTERLESHKQRQEQRKQLLRQAISINRNNPININKVTINELASTSHSNSNSTSPELQQQLLQENSQLFSEMASAMLSTVASCETQILHLARLQATLTSHLDAQHDLTLRLFADSERVEGELGKGNEYLRRAGRDGSAGRIILVALMLVASLILLMLHYLKG